ncbi:hypothetical protein BDF14DRAFT_1839085 [Spinellus fusiger]|nr:hypothetical protein BDF14DRAFT_1839085 [Spinellus fusiger]
MAVFHSTSLRQRTKHTTVDDDDDYEEPPSESTADISSLPLFPSHTPYRRDSTSSNESSDFLHIHLHTDSLHDSRDARDPFIDLAQAALEEATVEEDQRGVIQEVVETLIAQTGAPLVVDAIAEQRQSQDIIEKLAESHQEEQLKYKPNQHKYQYQEVGALKEPEEGTLPEAGPVTGPTTASPTGQCASEYSWRLFRVLLLASVVGLVYHCIGSL